MDILSFLSAVITAAQKGNDLIRILVSWLLGCVAKGRIKFCLLVYSLTMFQGQDYFCV
jgi:hypothetical protein